MGLVTCHLDHRRCDELRCPNFSRRAESNFKPETFQRKHDELSSGLESRSWLRLNGE
jgi:hypothetical protein